MRDIIIVRMVDAGPDERRPVFLTSVIVSDPANWTGDLTKADVWTADGAERLAEKARALYPDWEVFVGKRVVTWCHVDDDLEALTVTPPGDDASDG